MAKYFFPYNDIHSHDRTFILKKMGVLITLYMLNNMKLVFTPDRTFVGLRIKSLQIYLQKLFINLAEQYMLLSLSLLFFFFRVLRCHQRSHEENEITWDHMNIYQDLDWLTKIPDLEFDVIVLHSFNIKSNCCIKKRISFKRYLNSSWRKANARNNYYQINFSLMKSPFKNWKIL